MNQLHYKLFFFCLTVLSFHLLKAQSLNSKESDYTKDLYENYRYKEAITYGNTKIDSLTNLPQIDSLEVSKHYLHIVSSYYRLRQYKKSIEQSEIGFTYCPKNDQGKNVKAGIYYWKSFPEYFLNKPYQSYYSKLEALSIIKKLKKPDFTYLTSINAELSLDLSFMGYLEKATYYLEKALEANKAKLAEEYENDAYEPDRDLTLWLQYRLAQVLNKKINIDYNEQSRKKIKSILDDFQKYKDKNPQYWKDNLPIMYGAVCGFYGNSFIDNTFYINRPDSAKYYYNKGLRQFSKEDNTNHYNLLQYNLSRAHSTNGENNKALEIINLLISEENPSTSSYNSYRANLFLKLKKYDSWENLVHKTLSEIHSDTVQLKKDFSNFLPSTSIVQTDDILSLAEAVEALDTITPFLQKKESELLRAATIQFKNSYRFSSFNRRLNKIHSRTLYARLSLMGKATGKESIDNIIEDSENIENRFAWQQFVNNRQIVKLPVLDSLEQIEYQLRKQVVEAKKERNQKKSDSLVDSLERFSASVEKTYPDFSGFTQDEFDINIFQSKIKDDEIVLKYKFFETDFAVFQITKDTIIWQLKPWGKDEKKLISNHIDNIKNKSYKGEFSERLAPLLIPEIALDYNKIMIVPDLPIQQLQFETLKYKNKFLVEQKAIHYSSHLRFLFLNDVKIKPKEETSITLFAPKYSKGEDEQNTRNRQFFLEGAQDEANSIKDLFLTKAFIGEEATKENFLEQKSKSSVLHLAMHATMDEVNPEFSHFNFSKNQKLHLEELYALNIPVDLAVLSACNTAVGKNDNALNMASLQRAFSYAGTKATIASLWEVPDESTSKIMISFYENLKDGHSKSEALQKAKMDYLDNTKVSILKRPYYWAGFVLYGADEAVIDNDYNSLWYFLGGFLMALIILFLWRKKKRKTN